MGALEIYVLNVGQADAAIIRTPGDNIIIIDAYNPAKVKYVLDQIAPGGEISHLIVTHPHRDHYLAVSKVLTDYAVRRVTVAPFWYDAGPAGYHTIINRVHAKEIPLRFLGGYERNYPDGGSYPEYSKEICLELLGPPNDILKLLPNREDFNLNYLSIIARLTYGNFRMVFAGDAQMENWAHYDREGMLEEKCKVLKAAHHGSRRGTQWERLERLSPKLVIVSSNPESGHNLPDLIGSATFLEYDDTKYRRKVVLTAKTGTIKIVVDKPQTGRFKAVCYGDKPTDRTIPGPGRPLPRTNWSAIVKSKIEE
ncbi:MAG: MBL fold metallo-hydrolase [Chloroflexi bacterium]|jgi:competence protein ComEC|nr:MBL fold metallo-hydrolase [Chloroflexota bacterium]